MNKVYKCCICHKTLKDKPIRLVKQEYAITGYRQFANVDRFDICKRCYKIFDKWIQKHRKEVLSMEEQTVTCKECGNTETIVVEDATTTNTITCPNCGGEEE